MPHINVKLFPGQPDALKQRLTEAIVKETMAVLGCKESSVSVAFEEVEKSDWKETVYQPEIQGKAQNLYKKPGYEM